MTSIEAIDNYTESEPNIIAFYLCQKYPFLIKPLILPQNQVDQLIDCPFHPQNTDHQASLLTTFPPTT